MLLSRALADFVLYLRDVERKRPRTVNGYERDLQALVALADRNQVTAFTPALTARLLASLTQRGLGVASLHRHMSALRTFARWGLKQHLWTTNPTDQLPRIRAPKHKPKPFTRDELGRLMRLELPQQERAIRGMLFWTGMRATPLCELTPDDVDIAPTTMVQPQGERVSVAGKIRSIGKGDVEMIHYMQEPLKDALYDHWFNAFTERRRTLFWRVRDGKPHSMHSLWWMTKRWGRLAGVTHVHPHRFRHSFGTEMLRQGHDPRTIQVLMGHASIVTTMGYMEVDNARAALAAMSLADEFWRPAVAPPPELIVKARIAALRAELEALEGSGPMTNTES